MGSRGSKDAPWSVGAVCDQGGFASGLQANKGGIATRLPSLPIGLPATKSISKDANG